MIKTLTSLRFVFAFMVFMSHYILYDKEINPFLYHVFCEGYVGVSFFFILSGFILAHVYQKGFEDNKVSRRFFYVARLARIYPLHILTMFIWAYMKKNQPLDDNYITNFIANIFLVQSFYPIEGMRFNSAAWSLSTEMFFYLLFPLLVAWFTNARRKFLIGFALAGTLILFLCPVLSGTKNEEWFLYVFPPVRLLDFILGILLYNMCQTIKVKNLVSRISPTLLELVTIVVFFVFYFSAYFIPQVYRHALWYWLPVGLFISVFYFQAGRISKFLSNDTLVWLGEISFAFYLLHEIILWYVTRALFLMNISVCRPVIFVLGLIISIVVSGFSLKYMEMPASKWVKRKLN